MAVLAFIAHHKLPYRKILEFTGILLASSSSSWWANKRRKCNWADWIPTTTILRLQSYLPDWLGLWFSVFPTVETLAAQAAAAVA